MRTTPEERLHLRTELAQGFGPLSEIVLRLLDDHDDLAGRISKAIDASDNDGGSASDAIQDMLAILGDRNPLPTYCAYCGHRVASDTDAASVISEHIATCEKHPLHKALRQLARSDELINERGRIVEEILALTDGAGFKFEQATDAVRMLVGRYDEERRALARWVAWHFMKQGVDFPPESERPSVHAQRQAAARAWDEQEAFRLFPIGRGEALVR